MVQFFRSCRKLGAVAVAVAMLLATDAAIFAQTTGTSGTSGSSSGYNSGTSDIPSVGVDVVTMITNTITNVGVVVAVAIGGYFGFLGLRRAAKWARTAFG